MPQLGDFQTSLIFQQEGVPPHWGPYFLGFLNQTFPDRWIGRDDPILWPPWSLDIIPGESVRYFYRISKREIITDIIATIDDAMVQGTWQEIEYRLDCASCN